MIDPKTLTEADIGRVVIFKPFESLDDPSCWEYGSLSSYREDGAIFVRFRGPNGERCSPDSIYWEKE